MTSWLSKPVDTLLDKARDGVVDLPGAILVVGSGYGGSLAALRLRQELPERRVIVLERGKEYALGEFPESVAEAPAHIRVQGGADSDPKGYPGSLFDVHIGDHVDILVGSGVGGTSLINANVAEVPDPAVLDDPRWPSVLRGQVRQALQPGIERVTELLGIRAALRAHAGHGGYPKFHALATLAGAVGAGFKAEAAKLAVTFEDGRNAAGVMQHACIDCGNCVTGCNSGAKNTLAMNVLPLAVSLGVEIYAGATVLSVARPAGDDSRWEVRLRRTLAIGTEQAGERFLLRVGVVVLSAGTLGSTEILLRSRARGDLHVSTQLGRQFSTNGDGIVASSGQAKPVDAIGVPTPAGSGVAAPLPGAVNPGPTITGLVRVPPCATVPGREGSADAPPAGPRARLTLEDGAVPAALVTLFGQANALAAQAQRVVAPQLPALFREQPALDPLTGGGTALRHAQLLLVMGDDGGRGALELRRADDRLARAAKAPGRRAADAWDHAHAQVEWPDAASNPALLAADSLLQRMDRCVGLDGGQYVPNPLWRLFPPQAAGVMSGALPGGRTVSVHPLGGCVMGDSHESGVVDHIGAVFHPRGGPGHAVHAGLYVVDGAIVPLPLAINPFLTISALAWRAAGHIACQLRGAGLPDPLPQDGRAQAAARVRPRWIRPARRLPRPCDHDTALELQLCELLTATVPRLPAWLIPDASSAGDPAPERWLLALTVAMTTGDAAAWSNCPGDTPLRAEVVLEVLPAVPRSVADGDRDLGVPGAPGVHAGDAGGAVVRRFEGKGEVRLFRYRRPGILLECWRALLALIAFWQRRGIAGALSGPSQGQTLGSLVGDTAVAVVSPAGGLLGWLRSVGRAVKRVVAKITGFLSAAWHFWLAARFHAHHRTLEYTLDLRDVSDRAHEIHLEGRKLLSYRPIGLLTRGLERGQHLLAGGVGHTGLSARLWDSLFVLPVTITSPRRAGSIDARLRFDFQHALNQGRPRIVRQRDLPSSVEALAGVAGAYLRPIFQTNFWEFAGAEYPDRRQVADVMAVPITNGDRRVLPAVLPLSGRTDPSSRRYALKVHAPTASRALTLRLVRYAQEGRAGPGAPVVLLLHGLAQSSRIFSTGSVDQNLAGFLWSNGFDVWMLDYRISTALSPTDGDMQASIEEVARLDLPAALRFIRACRVAEDNRSPAGVHLFAHCVGSTATVMAILEQWIPPDMPLLSVALNAIHPWVRVSPVNRVRARFATALRGVFDGEALDPVPQPLPGLRASLMDRLAFTVARFQESPQQSVEHRSGPVQPRQICDRMTLLYGRMWNHDNLDPRTHEEFLDLCGMASPTVYRELYYFANRERVTDREGENRFLEAGKIGRHWTMPTLFLHGADSKVFDPVSAEWSALRLRRVRAGLRNHQESRRRDPGRNDPTHAVLWKQVPDFGHMDVVFAAAAATEVYPAVLAFFAEARKAAADQDWAALETGAQGFRPPDASVDPEHDHPFKTCPATGPFIRAAWVDQGRVWLRVWAELPEYETLQARGLRATGQGCEWWCQLADNRPAVTTLLQGHAPRHEIRAVPGVYWLDLRLSPGGGPVGIALDYEGGEKGVPEPSPAVPGTPLGIHPAPAWLVALQLQASRWPQREEETPLQRSFRFLAGSCLYPGTPLEFRLSKEVFAGMCRHVTGIDQALPGVDLVFLIGDQIYADAAANIVDTETWREHYIERYRFAFRRPLENDLPGASGATLYPDGQVTASVDRLTAPGPEGTDSRIATEWPSLLELARRVPVHLAVDDHEIRDNWSGFPPSRTAEFDPADVEQCGHALASALAFQGHGRWRVRTGVAPSSSGPSGPADAPSSRGPSGPADAPSSRGPSGSAGAFWYALDDTESVCPAFVMDTRTERRLRKAGVVGTRARMFGVRQRAALGEWLMKCRNDSRPKFLFSGLVHAPVERDLLRHGAAFRDCDEWAGYPSAMAFLIRKVVELQVQKLVLVGGDLHFSAVARLWMHDGNSRNPAVQAWQVVSSGLYAPIPFANAHPGDYDWGTHCRYDVPGHPGVGFDYQARLLTTRSGHFVRVDASETGTGWQLSVSAHDSSGKALAPDSPGQACPWPATLADDRLRWTL